MQRKVIEPLSFGQIPLEGGAYDIKFINHSSELFSCLCDILVHTQIRVKRDQNLSVVLPDIRQQLFKLPGIVHTGQRDDTVAEYLVGNDRLERAFSDNQRIRLSISFYIERNRRR